MSFASPPEAHEPQHVKAREGGERLAAASISIRCFAPWEEGVCLSFGRQCSIGRCATCELPSATVAVTDWTDTGDGTRHVSRKCEGD